MTHDPIAARDAELRATARGDEEADALEAVSRAWERLDAFEPGLRALIEGAFSRAKFRAERVPSHRVATPAGVAAIIAYSAHRDDLARALAYRLVGTLSWESSGGPDGRFDLVWDEQTLRYGETERHVSFPASIEPDGSIAVNGAAFGDAVAVAMG
jgi:hypothetical protein